MATRVGILLTHPTQYHTPWFQELAKRTEIEIKVFYCFQPNATQQGIDFGVAFKWDTPLLEGYPNTFLKNVARVPGFHFSGCDTPEIATLINSKKYDAWIINGWKVKSDWQAIKSCWKNEVPMLIRGDSHLLDRKSLLKRIAKRAVLGRWVPRFDRYLTVGKLNEDFYRFYGANPRKFSPVRHFVDNERFAQQARKWRLQRLELRGKWQIRANAVVALFAGKFIEKKRPLDVVQAIERLHAQSLNIHLLMVGEGVLRPAIEDYVREKRLPVTFTGFLNQNEISMAYACSDVLVLPSSYAETWGLVVNEAMSCGLPAIVSDRVGCGPDLIVEESTGSIFPVGNVGSLATAISSYLSEASRLAEHGLQASQQVAAYNIKAAADNTVAALRTIEYQNCDAKTRSLSKIS